MSKHPGGRPPKYKTVEEMAIKIDEYFKQLIIKAPIIDKKGDVVEDENGNILYKYIEKEPPTVLGLCLYLDIDRDTLLNYEKKEEFIGTIKKAKARIEQYAENCLFDKDRKNVAGIVFNLKNNFGWKDKQEVENTINARVNIVEDVKKKTDADIEEEIRKLQEDLENE